MLEAGVCAVWSQLLAGRLQADASVSSPSSWPSQNFAKPGLSVFNLRVTSCVRVFAAPSNYAGAHLASYDYAPETKADLELAELPTVDLSKLDTDEGKREQARVLIDAVRTKDFFYVTWYAIAQERIDVQFGIGQKFYELSLEEKLKLEPDLESGDYNGYRPAGRRIVNERSGLKDRTEAYNIPKFIPHFAAKHAHYPPVIADNLTEIE
ncbi:hypothetical protein HK405_010383 [Cladochytrium tenue]|nr:hypothetical protein HK405_010383 [Cladochytrium tenue]